MLGLTFFIQLADLVSQLITDFDVERVLNVLRLSLGLHVLALDEENSSHPRYTDLFKICWTITCRAEPAFLLPYISVFVFTFGISNPILPLLFLTHVHILSFQVLKPC